MFLFSEANQRVYRLEYVHLKFDVVLPLLPIIESKAWREFFICSPTQQLRGKSEQAPEPSLGEYLSAVRAWEVHGNQAEESVLTTGQKVSVIAFGGFLAIVVIVIGLRVRKLRHLNIRAYSSMLKTRYLYLALEIIYHSLMRCFSKIGKKCREYRFEHEHEYWKKQKFKENKTEN